MSVTAIAENAPEFSEKARATHRFDSAETMRYIEERRGEAGGQGTGGQGGIEPPTRGFSVLGNLHPGALKSI
jgi:hypothetical protein